MMNSWRCLLLTAITSTAFVVSSETDCSEFYQHNGPRITPCKKEIILQNGQNFTLKCRANSIIQFKQQDVLEENIGNFSIIDRNFTHDIGEYKYEIDLELINVDRYAIGYYACKDSSVERDVLNYLTDEPNNTEYVSYIYIYVDGTDSLFAPMREVVISKLNYYVVECRPTTPDVEVKIFVADIAENTYKRYSPKLGFVFDSDSIEVLTDSVPLTIFTCGFKKQNRTVDKDLFFVKQQKEQPQPIIIGGDHEFLEGGSFSLSCSVNYTRNLALNLTWKYPNDTVKNGIIEDSNNDAVLDGFFYRNITILNATKEHAGVYTCVSKNNCVEKKDTFMKIFVDKPYLKVKKFKDLKIESPQKDLSFSLEIKSYPPANFTIYKRNIEIKTKKNETYEIKWKSYSSELVFTVSKKGVEDSDNYTVVISNGHQTENVTYDLRFQTAPVIHFGNTDKTCVQNVITSLQCEVTGYPLPTVEWIFSENETAMSSTKVNVLSIYKEIAILDTPCLVSGNVTCKASNSMGVKPQTTRLLVYELPNGFGIQNQTYDKTVWFPEHKDTSVKCMASKYNFTNVTWTIDDVNEDEMSVEYSENNISLVAKLKIKRISLNHTGTYECRAVRSNGSMTYDTININVAALEPPVIIFTSNINGNVQEYQPIQMNCLAYGVPRPSIQWYKGINEFKSTDPNIEISNNIVNRTTVNSTIIIRQMEEVNHGTYECVATNGNVDVRQSATLVLKEAAYKKYLIGTAVIFFVSLILVIYLICKIKKEKQFRKELAAAGLLYFKEGVTKSLNPDLGIDEQAELLPYDEKFEFPPEKLVFGKQLGAGAFGVVYKAEARGIINAEETTPVAVKMVKKTADNMFIKALASELKIMVHLGKHINIVNLLGACTKNVGKRELVVIVEYCKFGNIHNYMQRHREVFIDQFSDNNKEKSFGKVNRGYDSTGSTGVQSDYGTANTQETDHTFLTNNTNRTSRKNAPPSQPKEVVKASEGYVQPEWRSNYETDYSYDGRSPRPLTSRDLLAWAFQIARGMEYLASRKVLHGDLAARNILLADDNIVKICDFGLARSIYKNDEYQKSENSLLPVKWLAIECMTDRIFSTQSDVWSFGIVLWELFSLAKTPYPNMSPADLLQFLSKGHRLDKPAYSDDRIYNLMKRCWEQKPTARPSFTQLQEILGTFLEDNVRNHYVDLNSAFMDLNSKPDGQEDYLAMVCAPDYNNLVTPSPHHYVNESNDARRFFPPTPTKVDEDGYLQMSPAGNQEIFSPKPTGTKFDFDSRKFNSRPSEASNGGSELTPMLTLNNLPRSGSDSDHEGNASPYPKVCPRIEEETDEVFETKQYNAKNAQNSAVSNPTYITFDIDVEKKPIDIKNYVNIVPNGGLVK